MDGIAPCDVDENVFSQNRPEVADALRAKIVDNIARGRETRPALAFMRKCQVYTNPERVSLRISGTVPNTGGMSIGNFAFLYQRQKQRRGTTGSNSGSGGAGTKAGASRNSRAKKPCNGGRRKTTAPDDAVLSDSSAFVSSDSSDSDEGGDGDGGGGGSSNGDAGGAVPARDSDSDPEFLPDSVRRRRATAVTAAPVKRTLRGQRKRVHYAE